MNAVIIFDLNDIEGMAPIKEFMRTRGYNNSWSVPSTGNESLIYHLPHNMIWKKDTSFKQAHKDLSESLVQLNSSGPHTYAITRLIMLNSTPWGGIKGI